jgi:protein O-mannosyl-transferase
VRAPRRWLALGVGLAAVAAWAPGLRGPYLYDDVVTPLDDPASQSLGAFARHLPRTLRPLTKLTYALEATVGLGAAPAARRAVSLALHGATAALLVLLLAALAGEAQPPAPARVAAARAGPPLLALLWAVHPIHAESILALAGRSATLAGLLLVAALLCHARGRRRAGALCFLAAVLARETALAGIVPLVALELTLGPRPARESEETPRRGWARAAATLARLAPYGAALLLAAVWVAATPRYRHLADYSLHGRPFGASLVEQVAAVPVGLSLYVRPAALSMDHGVPLGAGLFAVGLALYLAAALGLVAAVRRKRALVAVGLALWLAALLPTQSVVPKLDPLTERPLALALAGLVLALGAVPLRGRARALAAAVGLAGILALAGFTVARGQLYRSALALYGDAAAKSRTNPRPHLNYAAALIDAGRRDEARAAVDAALRLAPVDGRAAAMRAGLAR